MIFHTFGNAENPIIILIHGALTPWQVWDAQIKHFSKKYYVVAAALNAHTENEQTEFISIEKEAMEIEKYCIDNFGGEVYGVFGLSMGGAIAHILWRNGIVKIKKLVMDGAPLIPMGRLSAAFMTKQYISLIRSCKKRSPKTLKAFKKNFLPEKYLEAFLIIADRMTDSSIKNMLYSVCESELFLGIPKGEPDVLFIHGTKGNEAIAIKSSIRLKKAYPESRVFCFRGCKHCEAAIYKPEKWIEAVENFIKVASKNHSDSDAMEDFSSDCTENL